MGNYDKGGDRGRNGGFGGGRRDGGRPSFSSKSWPARNASQYKAGGGDKRGGGASSSMHKAICSECGKTCEVPFKPTGDKPVYCKECFGEKKNVGFREERAPRREYASDRSPVRTTQENNGGSNDTRKQLDALNAKLDRLIQAVEGMSKIKAPQTIEAPKSVKIAKSVVKDSAKKTEKKPAPKTVVKKAKSKKK